MVTVAKQSDTRCVETFLRDTLENKRILVNVMKHPKSQRITGMPSGSRSNPDEGMINYEQAKETLDLVNDIISYLPTIDRRILDGLSHNLDDSDIISQLGYSTSHYYHVLKPHALKRFEDIYPYDLKHQSLKGE